MIASFYSTGFNKAFIKFEYYIDTLNIKWYSDNDNDEVVYTSTEVYSDNKELQLLNSMALFYDGQGYERVFDFSEIYKKPDKEEKSSEEYDEILEINNDESYIVIPLTSPDFISFKVGGYYYGHSISITPPSYQSDVNADGLPVLKIDLSAIMGFAYDYKEIIIECDGGLSYPDEYKRLYGLDDEDSMRRYKLTRDGSIWK